MRVSVSQKYNEANYVSLNDFINLTFKLLFNDIRKMGYTATLLLISLLIFQPKLSVALNASVTLSPSVAEVIANGDVSLTCTYNGTENLKTSSWTRSSAPRVFATISIESGICSASGFLTTAGKYHWRCFNNNTFTLILKDVERNKHGEKWKCLQNFHNSNEIAIFVKVPIQVVHINANIYTGFENTYVQLMCNTSYCRPAAEVTWFLDSGTSERNDDIIISSGNQTLQNTTDIEGLVSVSSTLTYGLNRSVNNWSIYCAGNNIENRNATLSKETKLNIIYPPDGPPVINGFINGSVYKVIEGQLANISCSITGGNPSASLQLNCNGGQTEQVNIDTIVVTWRARRHQNKNCQCTSNHTITGIISTEIAVNVLYPTSHPVFSISSSPVYVIVNQAITINCTSNSRPLPKYTWILPDSSTLLGQSLNIENVVKTDSGTFSCTAENIMFPSYKDNVTSSNTSYIDIDVLFPPTQPFFRYGNISGAVITSKSINVVENDTFSITCGSNGNPEPMLTWGDEKEDLAILTVSSISTDLTKTCFATNMMNETIGESRIGSAEAEIAFTMLYPPRQPTIKYFNSEGFEIECVSQIISVIENTSFSLYCLTDGRPEPRYSWYGPITSKNGELKIENINKIYKGEYSCNAFNEMKRTFGSSQDGLISRKVTLNILYPPAVGYLENQTYIEGTALNLNCPVKSGNPGISSVIWTRSGDNRQWNTSLFIASLQRNDDMIYTCIASNTMTPSCENETEGYDSRSFHLNVVYEASVVKFYVNGLIGQPEVTVNENDSLEFSCQTESKPKSLITIGFNTNSLISQPDVNSLTIDNLTATCSRHGVYSCSGSNTYNMGKESYKYLTLRVKCFPRVSLYVYVRDKIYTNEHATVSINFTVLAYPVPAQSGYKWQRQNGLKWSTLKNGPHVRITTSGLKTNLTIINVTKLDFGKYRLSIENDIGLYEQTFYLIGKAPPDKPSEFRVVEENLTDTAVTLMWKPGFNYGSLPQYILQYKDLADNEWTSVNVMDTMRGTLNYTIEDLSSGTEYKSIIFAISDLGSSDNQSIVFQTKAKPETPLDIEIVPESIGDASVIVRWTAGFDGGVSQKFILKYTIFLRDDWVNVSQNDTGGKSQSMVLNNLSNGSKYKLLMIAINTFGISDESETVTFETKEKCFEQSEIHSTSIGLLAALSVSSVLNISLIILMICMRKGRWFARGHFNKHKTKDDKVKLRASCHSLTDHTGVSNSGAYEEVQNQPGQDITMVSKGYTRLDKLKQTVTSGKLAMYEEIKTPGSEDEKKIKDGGYEVPVSKREIIMSSKENKPSSGETTTTLIKSPNYKQMKNEEDEAISEQHYNLTEYINLDDLSKKK